MLHYTTKTKHKTTLLEKKEIYVIVPDKSAGDSIYLESIQSSTAPDPGLNMGK